MTKRKKAALTTAVLALLLALGLVLTGKGLVEQRLMAELEARGFKDVHLRVSRIGLNSTVFDNISLGSMPLALDNLTIDYSLPELWRGSLSDTSLRGSSPNLHLKAPSFEATSGQAVINLKRKGSEWSGTWSLKDIILKDHEAPPLAAEGTITASSEKVLVSGTLKSPDGSHRAQFTLEHVPSASERSVFTLVSARIPLQGGNVSVRSVRVPLVNRGTIQARLEVQSIQMGSVLQALTGQRANATGIVSGVLPISITADNAITFNHGTLQAEAPGTITLAPEAIPGDNEQVTLLRDVLKNFHYTALLIGINSDNDKKLTALLSLEGSNPDAYNGRTVKLNVHLGGDVLDFVEQNLLSITNPEKLLKQGNYANP